MIRLVPDGVIADLSNIMNATMEPASATIKRTGAVYDCRILADIDKRGVHLEGMPTGVVHLQRWDMSFPASVNGISPDIVIGDTATLAGKGDYTIFMVQNPTSINTAFSAFAVELGTPIIAQTIRQPSALSGIGVTATYSTYLSSLSIRPLAGMTWLPARGTYDVDAFGVNIQAPYTAYADWPTGNADIQPVQPNDIIVMPDTSQFVVSSAQGWHGWRLAITVEMDVT